MTELDKTIKGITAHKEQDEGLNRTIPNMRVRRERGTLQAGDVVLNRYELVKKLGSGAMGIVYLCKDRLSQEQFALKMVPPELARDKEVMEKILVNFRLVHNLHHPNIASVEFLDKDEYGRYFLIMEYVQGQTLSSWKANIGTETDLEQICSVIWYLASALDYAHAQKILHRDVKPANVIISNSGEVKLLDFGLASEVRSSMTSMSTHAHNSSSGTPNYMAPELFRGQYPRPAADQYALAVIAYELLSGHLPFTSDNMDILFRNVVKETPEKIKGIPEHINQALLKAMAKEPKDRFESCEQFAKALTAPEETVPGTAKQSNIPVPKQKSNRKVIYALIAGIVLLGCAAGAGTVRMILQDNKKPVFKPKGMDFYETVYLPGNIKLKMVKVEKGSFTMSKENGENLDDDIIKEHPAALTKDFFIGRTEVTQAQWTAVMGNDPAKFKGKELPVEQVSWNDAMAFCKKLNELTEGKRPAGYHYTLPTETQWEYACCGGKLSSGCQYSGSDIIDDIAWHNGNSGDKTHQVGEKQANELGLYDMSGNVWEWCLDDWHSSSNDAAAEFSNNGKTGDASRVSRGGSWFSGTRDCRSVNRVSFSPDARLDRLGFRLVLAPLKY